MGRRRHYILDILEEIHKSGFITTKSDPARILATEVAALCQQGLITTQDPKTDSYTNQWRLTPAGLDRITNQHYYA